MSGADSHKTVPLKKICFDGSTRLPLASANELFRAEIKMLAGSGASVNREFDLANEESPRDVESVVMPGLRRSRRVLSCRVEALPKWAVSVLLFQSAP